MNDKTRTAFLQEQQIRNAFLGGLNDFLTLKEIFAYRRKEKEVC